jgi:hypothetical protein
MPNLNMHFKIKCKARRKSLETKKKTLPSVKFGTWQKTICAKYRTAATQQRLTAYTTVALCRVPSFAECSTLGKEPLCRGPAFAECLELGKEPLCRVPMFAECGTRQRGSLPSA